MLLPVYVGEVDAPYLENKTKEVKTTKTPVFEDGIMIVQVLVLVLVRSAGWLTGSTRHEKVMQCKTVILPTQRGLNRMVRALPVPIWVFRCTR